MEDLRPGANRVGERRRADRHDHELLEVDAAVGMRAAVEDVHHRDRERRLRLGWIEPAEVRVERHAVRPCAAARASAIETPRIALAPSRPLFGVPSSSIRNAIDGALIGLASRQRRGDLAVDVADRLRHALAEIAALVAVAQLERLALAGRRAGRHRRAPERAAVERDLHFDRGVAPRIENLSAVYGLYLHVVLLPCVFLRLNRVDRTPLRSAAPRSATSRDERLVILASRRRRRSR